jgi:uncharacterized protein YukE
MTSLSLEAGDWQVVDYTGNPVPGDPDAVSSLASQFLDQASQAQQRAKQLSSVHDNNEGHMQGDYAEAFDNALAALPAHSIALADTYQSCAEALSPLAADLEVIQSRAAAALQSGTEADAAYQEALDEYCSVVPLEFTGTGVWRGLNAATAMELAQPMAEETEDPELLDWAAEIGQYAGQAENDRQTAIATIDELAANYQDTNSRCAQAIQNAASSVPAPVLSS